MKQSVIQKRSYNSVKVFWLDQKALESNIASAVAALASERSEVCEVLLFGSIAEGRGVPASDVDILIIVEECARALLERPLDYLDYFSDIGLSVDCFVYTLEELDLNAPFIASVRKRGKLLYRKSNESEQAISLKSPQ